MSRFPVDLLAASIVNQSSNAVANTESDFTLLAAPGLSLRWRIWAIRLVQRQNTPAGNLNAFVQNLTTLATVGLLAVNASQPSDQIEFPGGIGLITNNGLRIATFASVVSMTFHCVVYYTGPEPI